MKNQLYLALLLLTGFGAFAQKPQLETENSLAASKTEAVAQPLPVAQSETAAPFKSPYLEKGLPAEAMRSMLLDADLAASMKNNRQLWIGDIMRIGLYGRMRGEFRDNLNFSAANPEKIARFSEQSQIFFFVNPTKNAEVKVTLQDARVWGGDGGTRVGDDRAPYFSNADNLNASRNNLDLREAYIHFRNVGLNGVGIQAGRQVLLYGDGRMIGSANWTFGGLSFDGVLLRYDGDLISSHLFGVKGTSSATNNMPNGGASNTSAAQGDSYLAGWYNTFRPGFAVLDLYAIGMFRNSGTDTACVTGVAGCVNPDIVMTTTNMQRSNLYTFGGRFTNRADNNKLPAGQKWDYTLEAAFQVGRASDLSFTDTAGNTRTVARNYTGQLYFAQTGYKILDDLRFGAQAYYSPGTENRTGASLNTFQTLPGPRFGGFPYLNNFNGISENMGMKNIFTPSVSLLYESKKWGDFVVSYFYEMKATAQDAWYGINGVANSGTAAANSSGRISTESASNAAGASLGNGLYQEIDLVWMQRFSNYFSIWIGAGYLHAGNAVSLARGSDFKADAFMGFVQLQGAL